MSLEGGHKKISVYEWGDGGTGSMKPGGGPTLAQPANGSAIPPPTKEFFDGAMACGEKKAYLIGGYNPKTQTCMRQVIEYNVVTKQFSRIAPDLPERLSGAAAAMFEEYCFVWGGRNDTAFHQSLYVLVPVLMNAADGAPSSQAAAKPGREAAMYTYRWETLLPAGTSAQNPQPVPCARTGHSLVLGQVSNGAAGTNPSFSYSPNGDTAATATKGGTNAPAAEPVLYLFGGFDGACRLNDVWRLWIRPSLASKEAVWERVVVQPGGAPTPRDDAAVAFAQSAEKLYVFGGYASGLRNDTHVLDLKDGKNQWTDLALEGPPTRRQGAIAAADDQNLLLCMGSTDAQHSIPQLVQISLKDPKWKLLAVDQCNEVLSNRSGFMGCCASSNRRLLIYGGGMFPFLTSMVEVELEKLESSAAANKKK